MSAPTQSVCERLHRAIELLANIGIIVVALLGGALMVRQLSRQVQGPAAVAPTMTRTAAPPPGAALKVVGEGGGAIAGLAETTREHPHPRCSKRIHTSRARAEVRKPSGVSRRNSQVGWGIEAVLSQLTSRIKRS